MNATFRSASTDLDHALVVCDEYYRYFLKYILFILFCMEGETHSKSEARTFLISTIMFTARLFVQVVEH